MQNKILSLLVDNTSGVLSRIAGMFSVVVIILTVSLPELQRM